MRVEVEGGHAHIGKYAWLVHEWLVVWHQAGNVIASYARDLETLEAEFARNLAARGAAARGLAAPIW